MKTQKLTKFLKNLFMKFNKYLSLLFLFVVSMAAAQQVEIKGKVTENSSSLPLPGVNVVIKNTTRGTTTDLMEITSSKQHQMKFWCFHSSVMNQKK